MEPPGEQQQLRSLRDFLLVYNRMTELCFLRCVCNLNYRALSREEEACLDGCAGKLVHSNHRLMGAYVQLMPSIVQRRISDYEATAAQVALGSSPNEVPGTAPATLPGPAGSETHPSQQVAGPESAPDSGS
ncbi:mitochondrial import inner membrane translocase subunit Tim10 B [Emydura macquarii macquarii]|uniref:mitochondrial import inner membrane translocase subunit Tim10 B n=1 Tax=Emydura macquarii macquarii TaxID=1129001 RepID=UPI00352B9C38